MVNPTTNDRFSLWFGDQTHILALVLAIYALIIIWEKTNKVHEETLSWEVLRTTYRDNAKTVY